MRSQFWESIWVMSPWMWGPRSSVGRRSQDVALWPSAMKAFLTMPLNSQAIKTFIFWPWLFDVKKEPRDPFV